MRVHRTGLVVHAKVPSCVNAAQCNQASNLLKGLRRMVFVSGLALKRLNIYQSLGILEAFNPLTFDP